MFVRRPSKHRVSVIKASASLLCTTLQYITRDKEEMHTKTFGEIYNIIKNWIHQSDVIGGYVFGGGNKDQNSLPLKYEEIEVCVMCSK